MELKLVDHVEHNPKVWLAYVNDADFLNKGLSKSPKKRNKKDKK